MRSNSVPYPIEEYGFGIWADRADISEDSVEYVNRIREESEKRDLSEIITDAEKKSGMNYLMDTDILFDWLRGKKFTAGFFEKPKGFSIILLSRERSF
jgi:hypothetical protein